MEDVNHVYDSIFALETVTHTQAQLINLINSVKGGPWVGRNTSKINKGLLKLFKPFLHLINLSIRTGESSNVFKIT